MPQKLAAKRALRKSARNRAYNIALSSKVKQAMKKLKATINAKNPTEAKAALPAVYAAIDKAASKKLIHRNKASRQKSRITKALNKVKA